MSEKAVSRIKPVFHRSPEWPGGNYRVAAADYARRACAWLGEHVEEMLPDGVYDELPGEMRLVMPLDGVASFEIDIKVLCIDQEDRHQ